MAAPDSRRGSINPILEMDEEPNNRSVYRIPSVKLTRLNYVRRYRMQSSRVYIVLLIALAAIVLCLSCALTYVLLFAEKSPGENFTCQTAKLSGESNRLCDVETAINNSMIQRGPSATSYRSNTSDQSSPFCQRPGCIQLAAQLLAFGDRQADPCTDFYQYACGNFHTSRPQGPRRWYNVRQMIADDNSARLQQLLLKKSENKLLAENLSAVEKARLFYVACLRSWSIGFDYGSKMPHLLNKLGGIPFFESWSPQSWNFNDVHAEIIKYHKAEMFFNIERTNSSHVEIKQAKYPIYLENDIRSDTHKETEQMYKDSLIRVFEQLVPTTWKGDFGDSAEPKCNSICLDDLVKDTMSFTELVYQNTLNVDLQMFSWGHHEENERLPLTMSLRELENVYQNFNWTLLITSLFGKTVELTSLRITVPVHEYLQKIDMLVGNMMPFRLQRYMISRLLMTYIAVEDARFSERRQNLDLQWQWKGESHTGDCLALLQTNLPRAVQGVFIHSHIGHERLNSVKEFIAAVKQSISKNLGWMGQRSQRYVQSQLSRLHVQFGALDSVVSEEALNHYYSRLVITPDDTLQNMLNINRFKADLRATGNADKIKLWQIKYPKNLDLVYVPKTGKLVVPYGALQVPWYHEHVPEAYNAATIGGQVLGVLATEFVPFVDTDPKWDADIHIWDNQSSNAVLNYFDCLTAKKDKTENDIRNKSKKNFFTKQKLYQISDVLTQQYELYMARHLYGDFLEVETNKKYQKSMLKLPGAESMTANQLFYTLFVQSQCEAEELVDVEPHQLPIYHSRTPLRQTINELLFKDSGFRQVFNCKSPTVTNKCSLF